MWIALRLKCNFIENLAYIIYLVVFYRLLVIDLERNFDFRPARPESFSVYWEAMRSRLCTFGISIVSIFATFFLKRKQVLSRDDSMIGENDTPDHRALLTAIVRDPTIHESLRNNALDARADDILLKIDEQ